MNKKSVFTVVKSAVYMLLILTIALALTLNVTKFRAHADPESTRVYTDPPSYKFDVTTNGTIGTLFNVTVKVEDVDDMKCYQVVMYYNDTIINITRWYEPTWDPEYVFYGKTTMPTPYPPDVKYEHVGPHNGSAGVGCCLFPAAPPGGGFTGDGTVCIFTFNITAVPPEGETYSCALDIDTPKTFWIKAGQAVKSYFDTYTNGEYVLVPEFSPLMMLSIFMVITIIAIALARKAIRKSNFHTVRVKN